MLVIGSIGRKGLGLFGANTLHMQPDLAGDIDEVTILLTRPEGPRATVGNQHQAGCQQNGRF